MSVADGQRPRWNVEAWPQPEPIGQDDPLADQKKLIFPRQLEVHVEELKSNLTERLDDHKSRLTAELEEVKTRVAEASELRKAEAAASLARAAAAEADARAQQSARDAADEARRTAEYANFYAVFQAVEGAYIDLAKTNVANALTRGQFVLTAAAAIGTLYTGLLGLVFKVDEQGGRRLPERGVWAGVFLGLAIVLASVYLAYITRPAPAGTRQPSAYLRVDALERVREFGSWAGDATLRRRYALQAAVVSLGVGVAFLPVAFTSLDDGLTRLLAGTGVIVVFGLPAVVRKVSAD